MNPITQENPKPIIVNEEVAPVPSNRVSDSYIGRVVTGAISLACCPVNLFIDYMSPTTNITAIPAGNPSEKMLSGTPENSAFSKKNEPSKLEKTTNEFPVSYGEKSPAGISEVSLTLMCDDPDNEIQSIISNNHPEFARKLLIKYLEQLIKEASNLEKDSSKSEKVAKIESAMSKIQDAMFGLRQKVRAGEIKLIMACSNTLLGGKYSQEINDSLSSLRQSHEDLS